MSGRAYLTLREFCIHTKLSEATIRRRCKAGDIPYVQPGGSRTRLLFRADALEQAPGGARTPPPQPKLDPPPSIPEPPPRWQAARQGKNQS